MLYDSYIVISKENLSGIIVLPGRFFVTEMFMNVTFSSSNRFINTVSVLPHGIKQTNLYL